MAKKGSINLPNSNIYLKGKGKDTNGNSIVKLHFPNQRAFSIQTNGNLPDSHWALMMSKNIHSLEDKMLETLEKESAHYIHHYGSKKQKDSLRMNVDLKEAVSKMKMKTGGKAGKSEASAKRITSTYTGGGEIKEGDKVTIILRQRNNELRNARVMEVLPDQLKVWVHGWKYPKMINKTDVDQGYMKTGGKIEYETRRIQGQKNLHDELKNTHFAIHKPTNSIARSWDYSEFDPKEVMEFKDDYFWIDVEDDHAGNVDNFRKADFVIVTRKTLEKRGIDLDDYLMFEGQKYKAGGKTDITNSEAVKNLIKDLEATPSGIGLALLRERLLSWSKADLKSMKNNPDAWDNPIISVGMYEDYNERLQKELSFDNNLNNVKAIKNLIQNLSDTPSGIGLAVFRERVLTHSKSNMKHLEKNPDAWSNPVVSSGMYRDLFNRIDKELGFSIKHKTGGKLGEKYLFQYTTSGDGYSDPTLEIVTTDNPKKYLQDELDSIYSDLIEEIEDYGGEALSWEQSDEELKVYINDEEDYPALAMHKLFVTNKPYVLVKYYHPNEVEILGFYDLKDGKKELNKEVEAFEFDNYSEYDPDDMGVRSHSGDSDGSLYGEITLLSTEDRKMKTGGEIGKAIGGIENIDEVYVEGEYPSGDDFHENQNTNDVDYVINDWMKDNRGLDSYTIFARMNDGEEIEIQEFKHGGYYAKGGNINATVRWVVLNPENPDEHGKTFYHSDDLIKHFRSYDPVGNKETSDDFLFDEAWQKDWFRQERKVDGKWMEWDMAHQKLREITTPISKAGEYNTGGKILRRVHPKLAVQPFIPYYERMGYNVSTKVAPDGYTEIIGTKESENMPNLGELDERLSTVYAEIMSIKKEMDKIYEHEETNEKVVRLDLIARELTGIQQNILNKTK
jgi:hypothetical protein